MSDHKSKEKPFHYQYELTCQMQTTIQEFDEDRTNHWHRTKVGMDWDPDGVAAYADKLAQNILKGTHTLTGDPLSKEHAQFDKELLECLTTMRQRSEELRRLARNVPDADVFNAVLEGLEDKWMRDDPPREDSLLRLVWERFGIDLADDAVSRIERGQGRLLKLMTLVRSSSVSESTKKFLGRVSRCYIWGFDPECVILCRGALDSEFKVRISDELCQKRGKKPGPNGFSLNQRIIVAFEAGIIDELEMKEAAVRIKKWGNDNVHDEPALRTDTFECIKDTLRIIEHLGKSKA